MALLSLEFHSLTEVKTETRKMTQLSHFVPLTLSISKIVHCKSHLRLREQKSGRGGSCKWPRGCFVGKSLSTCITWVKQWASVSLGGCQWAKHWGSVSSVSVGPITVLHERIASLASQPVQPVWLGFFLGYHFEDTHASTIDRIDLTYINMNLYVIYHLSIITNQGSLVSAE